uniref:Proline rich membrane anchor 1 n=1 Tax=Mus musculus TaxID=10090 RepID=D6RCX4_MOUSE
MLLRDLVLRHGCCWPSLLLHCALHPLWGLVQLPTLPPALQRTAGGLVW